MNAITIDQIQAAFKRKGFIMTDFNPFGIRLNDNEDLFTDIRGLLRKVNGAWEIYQWAATTKPGKSALLKPVNPAGCAILKEGQYINAWALGLHFGHDALMQCADVIVYRDTHKDGKIYLENEQKASAASGIDLHSVWCKEKLPDGTIHEIVGWDGVYSSVGNWSEGCQVIARPSDNAKFIAMCKTSGLKWFNYSLININDIV
jgi:hypothetical protein